MDIKHPFHAFPVYLYHATKPPIVANDSETEANALAQGYSEDYVRQEYPRHEVSNKEVGNLAEENVAKLEGYRVEPGTTGDSYPKILVKTVVVNDPQGITEKVTVNSAAEEAALRDKPGAVLTEVVPEYPKTFEVQVPAGDAATVATVQLPSGAYPNLTGEHPAPPAVTVTGNKTVPAA